MISAYLRSLKLEKGLSLKQVSELSNLPDSTISKIFDGSTADPRISTLVAIVTAMGGSIDEMTGIKPITTESTVDHSAMIKELEVTVQRNIATTHRIRKWTIAIGSVTVLLLFLAVIAFILK